MPPSVHPRAQGHHTFGFQRGEGCTVYREWAPGAGAAQLIGDFNGWNGTWMEKNEFGVWSVTLPDGERAPSQLLLIRNLPSLSEVNCQQDHS